MTEHQTQEIRLSGGTIRYRDEGKGPVLLFVHGLLAAGDISHTVLDYKKLGT